MKDGVSLYSVKDDAIGSKSNTTVAVRSHGGNQPLKTANHLSWNSSDPTKARLTIPSITPPLSLSLCNHLTLTPGRKTSSAYELQSSMAYM